MAIMAAAAQMAELRREEVARRADMKRTIRDLCTMKMNVLKNRRNVLKQELKDVSQQMKVLDKKMKRLLLSMVVAADVQELAANIMNAEAVAPPDADAEAVAPHDADAEAVAPLRNADAVAPPDAEAVDTVA